MTGTSSTTRSDWAAAVATMLSPLVMREIAPAIPDTVTVHAYTCNVNAYTA
jgi:hypothetical protein